MLPPALVACLPSLVSGLILLAGPVAVTVSSDDDFGMGAFTTRTMVNYSEFLGRFSAPRNQKQQRLPANYEMLFLLPDAVVAEP